MRTATIENGALIADKYRIEGVLGEGAMGVVYSAYHVGLQQRVAIKFLLTDIAQRRDAAERFRREAIAAASIRGEHACRVLDVGTHESGVPYMVMERLEGHNLAIELDRLGTIPYPQAIGYVLQACEALAEAHVLDIVHRDVKPANLFLARTVSGSHQIKVLDFGVAKSVAFGTPGHPALTHTSGFVGSPMYTSPEQLNSVKDLDARCDVWSLGVVLYELISGQPPFRGESFAELVAGILYRDPTPMREHGVELPAALIQVIERALSKRRDDRYASVGELADALAAFVSEEQAASVERTFRVLQASAETSTRSFAVRTPREPGSDHHRSSAARRLRATEAARRRRILRPLLISMGVLAALCGGLGWMLSERRAPPKSVPPPPPVAASVAPAPQQQVAPAPMPVEPPQALPTSTMAAPKPKKLMPPKAEPVAPVPELTTPETKLRDYGGRR